MKKAELISAIWEYLKDADIRKPISLPKQQFTITDDEGHSKTFTVKRNDKMVLYTITDIRNILDAFVQISIDTIKHGGNIFVPKIGNMRVHFRDERKVRIPGSRQWQTIPAHYAPKVDFAASMKEAARVYEAYVIEQGKPLKPEKPKRGRGRPRKEQPIVDNIDVVDEFGIPEKTIYDMYELDQDIEEEDGEEDVT